ncbi:MAG: hypothetical protein LDL12_07630, partial [Anaerolinea sp.]|nr:hypothetical protein [Anaerolinea sp.]
MKSVSCVKGIVGVIVNAKAGEGKTLSSQMLWGMIVSVLLTFVVATDVFSSVPSSKVGWQATNTRHKHHPKITNLHCFLISFSSNQIYHHLIHPGSTRISSFVSCKADC